MNLGTHAARALLTRTVAYGALETGSRVLQALSIFLLAYWFPKAQFGNFYVYLSVYQLVTVFGTGGLAESLMNRKSRAPDESGRAAALAAHLRAYSRRAASAAILFVPVMLLYADHEHIELNLAVLAAAILAGALNGLIVLVATNLTYIGHNRRAILLRSVYALIAYTLSLALAATTGNILVYFWGQLAVTLLIASYLAFRGRALAHVSTANVPRVGADGSGWFLVPAILNWFFWYGLVVCVSAVYGAEQAADLALANNIAQGLHIINLAVTQAWMGRYLQHFANSRGTAEARTVFVFRMQSLVMLFAAVGVVIAYEALRAMGVPLLVKYGEIGLPLAILVFAISASSNYFSAINAFAVNGQGPLLARILLVAYAISVLVLAGLAAWLGMLGVYIGLALLVMSRGFATAHYAMRRLEAGFFDWRLVLGNFALFALVAWYYAS
jgi:O-antigen/teichoic acid export membrane protein